MARDINFNPDSDNDMTLFDEAGGIGMKRRGAALQLAPRKRPRLSDPLVHRGRHFGRTIHALCNVQALLSEGLRRMGELADRAEDSFSFEEQQEFRVFQELLESVPGLEERVMQATDQQVLEIGELIQKGANSARSDDTKGLKGAVIEWITPMGKSLNPPLSRNVKIDRGFHHERTGELLCPTELDWADPETKRALRGGELVVTGDQWPVFLYAECKYDPNQPWKGLLRNELLVKAFKYIFTSPSSVEKDVKATRSCNARIHGMKRVTLGSIAYIATQVRFALSSCSVFSRSDLDTDSEHFYNTVLGLLHDEDEKLEVKELTTWWNRQVFPKYSATNTRVHPTTGTLANIKKKRAEMRKQTALGE